MRDIFEPGPTWYLYKRGEIRTRTRNVHVGYRIERASIKEWYVLAGISLIDRDAYSVGSSSQTSVAGLNVR